MWKIALSKTSFTSFLIYQANQSHYWKRFMYNHQPQVNSCYFFRMRYHVTYHENGTTIIDFVGCCSIIYFWFIDIFESENLCWWSFDNSLSMFICRALLVNLPSQFIMDTLACGIGLVVYSYFSSCDPLNDPDLDKRLSSPNQVGWFFYRFVQCNVHMIAILVWKVTVSFL